MFKRLFGATLILLVTTGLFAMEFGFKGGINYSGRTNRDDKKMGYQIGCFANIPINSKFSIQPELYYTSKESEYSSSGYQSYMYTDQYGAIITISGFLDYTLVRHEKWLNLPVLAKFTPVKNKSFTVGILAGPFAAYNIEYKETMIDHLENATLEDFSGTDHKFDYGIAFGISMEKAIKKSHLILDLRYALGGFNHHKNSIISAMLGFGFGN